MQQSAHRLSGRIAGIVVGAFVGGVIGLIVAVNLVIYLGPDQGYESSIADVFEHNRVLGLVVVGVIVAGPLVGIAAVRRIRSPQRGDTPRSNH